MTKIELNERALTPMFCENGDEFIKLVFVTLMSFSHDPGDEELGIEYITTGVRVLLHEYLALVLRGDIEPYVFGDNFVKTEMPGFKHAMQLANYALSLAGVEMKEGEGGKMGIDYNSLMNAFGATMDDCTVKKQKK